MCIRDSLILVLLIFVILKHLFESTMLVPVDDVLLALLDLF